MRSRSINITEPFVRCSCAQFNQFYKLTDLNRNFLVLRDFFFRDDIADICS